MTRVHQFYGGQGVPWSLPNEPSEVVSTWRSHRERLRRSFRELDDVDWSRPTRCSEWDAAALAQHLVSGAQFLGYTLHQARKGEATRLLEGFDAQATAAIATAQLDGLSHSELIEELERSDDRVDAELRDFERHGWNATAEAPPGHVSAHIALNHFLFDSWVHERDLLLPMRGELTFDAREAAAVVSYVLGLAGLARAVGDETPDDARIRVHLTDIERDVVVEVTNGSAHVTFCGNAEPPTTAGITCPDLVDAATGRTDPGSVEPGLADHLRRLATVMA